jgi:serine/threonine protein kinase
VLEHAGARYELLERLGGGPTSDVHVARALADGLSRFVCVKRLSGAFQAAHAAALREEARLLASVRHANVVSLLGLGDDPVTGPFLVLELVEGMDLSALSAALAPQGRMPPQLAVHIACALLRALAAVQRSVPGLVHRDVTPHNVLVSEHGEVKLADFGIAIAADAAAAEDRTPDCGQTNAHRRTSCVRPRLIKGKLGYMSPEQIRGDELDVRCDLFAVGVVLYELLAAQRPWGRIRGARDLCRVVDEDATPLGTHCARLDHGLLAAVDRLLARCASKRFASPEDGLRALAPYGAGELGSLRLGALTAHVRTPSMP